MASEQIHFREKWTCEQCTFLNESHIKKCAICQFAKPFVSPSMKLAERKPFSEVVKKSVSKESAAQIDVELAQRLDKAESEAEQPPQYSDDLVDPFQRMIECAQNSPKLPACIGCSICCLGMLLIVILIPESIRNVAADEYAIRYDGLTKKIHSEVYEEGKHVFTPETSLFKFTRTIQKITLDMTCLTSNGIGIPVIVDVQYQVPKGQVLTIFDEFGLTQNLKDYLFLVAADSVRDSISKFTAKEFYETRALIQDMIEVDMISSFEQAQTHVDVMMVVLSNYDFPAALDAAISDKRSSQNDIAIAENERAGQLMHAQTALLVAEINAHRLQIEARAEVDSIIAEANAKATSIMEVWANRESTYDEIKTSVSMNVTEFIEDYLTSIVLQTATSPIISLTMNNSK